MNSEHFANVRRLIVRELSSGYWAVMATAPGDEYGPQLGPDFYSQGEAEGFLSILTATGEKPTEEGVLVALVEEFDKPLSDLDDSIDWTLDEVREHTEDTVRALFKRLVKS